MGLVMIIGVVAFSVIYSVIDPLTNDFVSDGSTTTNARVQSIDPTPTAGTAQAGNGDASGEELNLLTAADPTKPPAEATEPSVEATEAAPVATETPEAFEPDYRIASPRNINLRSEPGTNSSVVVVLAPGQPLQSLGATEATSNPGRDRIPSGGLWREFQTEDGEQGWVRDIDVETLSR